MAIATNSEVELHMYLTVAPLGSVHVEFNNELGFHMRYKSRYTFFRVPL